MADAKTILQKYVSDMLSLEQHIYQAIDKQAKEENQSAEVRAKYEKFAGTLKGHESSLEARLSSLGGAANKPVKEAASAVAGVGAGLIDAFRSDSISKKFRDDFAALSLSIISYQMLHTTALSLGDKDTAELAARNVKDNADFVSEIERFMPTVVVSELKKNNKELQVQMNDQATQETQQLITNLWKNS
jgi:ferritin-like metal-binding protein YciE